MASLNLHQPSSLKIICAIVTWKNNITAFTNGNKTLYVISESTGDKKPQITEVLPREKRRTESQGNFSPSPYTISENLLRETTTTTTT